MNEFVKDNDAQKALDFIRFKADAAAEAESHLNYLQDFKKVIIANEMKKHLDKPLAAQEREAYASEAYLQNIQAIEIAKENHVLFTWKKQAAAATLDVWRSLNATRRSEGKMQ
jgi:hypothetical protein